MMTYLDIGFRNAQSGRFNALRSQRVVKNDPSAGSGVRAVHADDRLLRQFVVVQGHVVNQEVLLFDLRSEISLQNNLKKKKNVLNTQFRY